MPSLAIFNPFLRTTLTISTQKSLDGSLKHLKPENKRLILKMKTLACPTPDVNLLSITESISTLVEGDQIFNYTIARHCIWLYQAFRRQNDFVTQAPSLYTASARHSSETEPRAPESEETWLRTHLCCLLLQCTQTREAADRCFYSNTKSRQVFS